MGLGLELLPLSSALATPGSPKLRTAESAVLGVQQGLSTHPCHADAALTPHSEWGGALKGREPGPTYWPCDLGQAEWGLSVVHCRHSSNEDKNAPEGSCEDEEGVMAGINCKGLCRSVESIGVYAFASVTNINSTPVFFTPTLPDASALTPPPPSHYHVLHQTSLCVVSAVTLLSLSVFASQLWRYHHSVTPRTLIQHPLCSRSCEQPSGDYSCPGSHPLGKNYTPSHFL